MAETSASRPWAMRGVFSLLAMTVIFFHLMPLSLTPSQWAPPDVFLALAFAWAVRRPEYVPALLVAAIALLMDFLFQRPPGLWAVLVLGAVQWAKSLERQPEENGFPYEWANFAVLVIAVMVAYRAVLALTIVDAGPVFLATMQALFTILIYPLVVAVSHFIFRVRRTAPGDLEGYS